MKKYLFILLITLIALGAFSEKIYLSNFENDDIIVHLYVEKPSSPFDKGSSLNFPIIENFNFYTNWFGNTPEVYNYFIEIINKKEQIIDVYWDDSKIQDQFGNLVRPILFRSVDYSPFEEQNNGVLFKGGMIKEAFVPITNVEINGEYFVKGENFINKSNQKYSVSPINFKDNNYKLIINYSYPGNTKNAEIVFSLDKKKLYNINKEQYPFTAFAGYSIATYNKMPTDLYNYQDATGFEGSLNFNNLFNSFVGLGTSFYYYRYSYIDPEAADQTSQYDNDTNLSLFLIADTGYMNFELGTGTNLVALNSGFQVNDIGIHMGLNMRIFRNIFIGIRGEGFTNNINLISLSLGYNF